MTVRLNHNELDSFEYMHPNVLTLGYEYAKRRANELYADLLREHPELENRPYQPELAAIYASRTRDICAGGQGLGKTLITALCIQITHDVSNLSPGSIHIIVPALLYAKCRWLEDFHKFNTLQGYVEVISSEKQILTSKAPIWIYTMDFPKNKSKKLKDKAKPFLSRLMKNRCKNLEYLIVDEAHHFMKSSLRSKHLSYLRRGAKRVLFLSGTLSDGQLSKMHFLLRVVYGAAWKTTESEFLRDFQTTTKSKTNYLTGEEELTDLPTRYLSHLSIFKIPDYFDLVRNKIHRVTLDNSFVKHVVRLPKPNVNVELLTLEPAHLAEYKDLVRQRLSEMQACRAYGSSIVGQSKALQAIQPLIACSNFPANYQPAKLQRLVELVEEFASRGLKTVVFNNYVGSGRIAHQTLANYFGENKVIRMYAEDELENPKVMGSEKRSEVLSKFLYDPDIIAGVFAIRLCGESIDLTKASAVIYYDPGWDVIKQAQATSRVVRPGAINPFVEIRYLVHQGTIDQHMYSLSRQKQEQMDLLLDFSPEYSGQSQRINVLDVLDLVISDI